MTRIKILDRSEMDAEQGRVHDEATASSSPVGGPYYAYIRLPKLFAAAQNMRVTLGKEPLSRREQQVINLVCARHWNARYPWFAQVRASIAAGISQGVIDAINARATPDLPDAREKACFAISHELLADKKLSDKTYADALKVMGEKDLVALIAVTGSFSMTCLTASAFEVDPPADNPTPLKA